MGARLPEAWEKMLLKIVSLVQDIQSLGKYPARDQYHEFITHL